MNKNLLLRALFFGEKHFHCPRAVRRFRFARDFQGFSAVSQFPDFFRHNQDFTARHRDRSFRCEVEFSVGLKIGF